MGSRGLVAVVAVSVGGLSASCASFGATPAPEPTPTPATVVDGGTDAGLNVVDAGLSTPGVVTNLVPVDESGFEGGALGDECAAHSTTYHGMGTKDSPAFGGVYACKVCRTMGVAGGYTFDTSNFVKNPPKGAHYRARAHVRNLDLTGQKFSIYLRTWAKPDTEQAEDAPSDGTTADDWTLLETEITITKPAAALDVFVVGTGPVGSCFLVDDVIAWQE